MNCTWIGQQGRRIGRWRSRAWAAALWLLALVLPPGTAAPASDDPVARRDHPDGLSADGAARVARRVCQELWGTDPTLAVRATAYDPAARTWTVELFADRGLDGWGCQVTLGAEGELLGVQYLRGD